MSFLIAQEGISSVAGIFLLYSFKKNDLLADLTVC